MSHVAGPYLRVRELAGSALQHDLPVATGPDAVWQPFPEMPKQRSLTLQQAASELLELIQEAVATTLGTRPVTATLSSGMDSSSVLAVCANRNIDVVPIAWSVPSVRSADETAWARKTAAALGLPLVEVQISPDTLLPEEGIITRADSPLFNVFDSAWKATGDAVSGLGRNSLVTGYPGDLLFSGWVTPTADLFLTLRWSRLVSYLHAATKSGAGYGYLIRREIVGPIARQAFPGWWVRRRRPIGWLHPSRHTIWRDLQRREIGRGILPSVTERRTRVGGDSLAMLAENPVLSEMGITQIHPLLDARLLEFALSLPTWLLYEGGLDKLVLREAMRGILPDEVIELEKIMPSDLAIAALRAREEPLMELTRSMEAARMDIVLEEPLQAEVESFMRGEHGNMSFWNALTLEDWLRRWW